MTKDERIISTGKRKNAIARVWMSRTAESEQILINKKKIEDYFKRETLKILAEQPLTLTNNRGKFSFYILANGGGISGQAGAVRHGIAKALEAYDPALRPILKKAGLLTRDSREKERKKYGQKGARARYQYSKR
ncbi:MAG: 30S ribosomal protein S9 [Deltaproteobacteria bacterium]|jgi:small subunit ribosomal protein S9|nr:30S ribosomal protein S9 [Deltaproteobacteria bacterium]